MTREDKAKNFDILHFVADNAGLSTFEAIEKAYYMGLSEREPCEDCISRKAALDKKWDVPYDGKYIQVVDVGDIKELPPVTPAHKKERWIPCSERLPENDADVLITNEMGIYIGWFDTDDHKWRLRDDYVMDSIVAWMPLPEKYRAETEVEE